MNCRAHAAMKAVRSDYNINYSSRLPSHCIIVQGTKAVRVPIAKSQFITKENFESSEHPGCFAELNLDTIGNLNENLKMIKKDITAKQQFNSEIAVLQMHHSANNSASAQLQITRASKDYIQIDYFDPHLTSPTMIIFCDVSNGNISLSKTIFASKVKPSFDIETYAEKVCAIYAAAEKFIKEVRKNDEKFYFIAPIPANALSYWKG